MNKSVRALQRLRRSSPATSREQFLVFFTKYRQPLIIHQEQYQPFFLVLYHPLLSPLCPVDITQQDMHLYIGFQKNFLQNRYTAHWLGLQHHSDNPQVVVEAQLLEHHVAVHSHRRCMQKPNPHMCLHLGSAHQADLARLHQPTVHDALLAQLQHFSSSLCHQALGCMMQEGRSKLIRLMMTLEISARHQALHETAIVQLLHRLPHRLKLVLPMQTPVHAR